MLPCCLIMRDDDLISTARKYQNLHHKLLNGSSYDLLPKNALNKFELILSHYLPKCEAVSLSKKIVQCRPYLTYRILIVNCIFNEKLANLIVIRVMDDSRVVFYDHTGREYCDWNDYLCNNKLPEGLMMYPMNGTYSQKNGEVQLEIKKTPCGELPSKADKYMYVAAEVISLITQTLPLFSIAKPYASHISVASGLANGYKIGHHSYELYDRYNHGQSVNFSDEDAALHWSHIGNSFLTFGLTYHRCFYGNPNPESDLDNLAKVTTFFVKVCSKEDITGACFLFKGQLLSQYMLDAGDDITQKIVKHLSKDTDLHLEPLIRGLRLFVNDKSSLVFRKLIQVDDHALLKVLRDIRVCYNVNGIQLRVHELAGEMEKGVVTKIVEEAKSWLQKNISDNQLQFRISSICLYGQRSYETIEELCQFLRVDNMEDILINNKSIFENIGQKKAELEELVLNASKQFPQLLSYAVHYAAMNNFVDWDKFKDYFIEKLYEDCASLTGTRPSISWIDVRSLQEVIRCNSGDGIFFVRPSNKSIVVCPQDLINLGKKFLGILSYSSDDVIAAKPEYGWTILVSRKKKNVICIGPKIHGEDISLNGCYPVFVKPLL
ncbi:hypothetical protein J437_LFUL017535 [Ladona fulva]|uniref:DUF4781 domain-containing protein n=1 Tax=Ladona fulva TaxID=123851 RepID=A0A8K0P863_LADFU|nr:hypothetical protein J437_LFUL017535 [Ladona fulva]